VKTKFLYTIITLISCIYCHATPNPETLRSPQNQVFQFCCDDTFVYSSTIRVHATTYLWIPENCKKLKGLLVLCRNVTEHTLVGDLRIRNVCAQNDLGILWCVPSFFSTENKDPSKSVQFLQHIIDNLAVQSGYTELSIIPWLPMGESGHLLMVDQLLDAAPNRCIAGIYVKNAHYFCKNRTTPILVAVGTSQEWDQNKIDIRARWKDLGFYDSIIKEHKANPYWPISLLIDGGSGHFDCPDWMIEYFAEYIDTVSKLRLSSESTTLRPINYETGYVTGLPLPKKNPVIAHQYKSDSKEDNFLPWFFNKSLAQKSFTAASINWNAKSQLPAFADNTGRPIPMYFRGITNPIPTSFESDGITFSVHSTYYTNIPENFLHAGEKLSVPEDEALAEWICGPIAPLGNNKFQIALDRTWTNSPICIALRSRGSKTTRAIAEPGYINLSINTEGKVQHISFTPLPTNVAGNESIPLNANSDSKMPVSFFVVSGPAIIKQNRLIFTAIPPRAKYPIRVTISAWQWGRATEPKVQTAQIVTQSIYINSSQNNPLN